MPRRKCAKHRPHLLHAAAQQLFDPLTILALQRQLQPNPTSHPFTSAQNNLAQKYQDGVRLSPVTVLRASGLPLHEGFGEALQTQVVIPHLRESLMLPVQAREIDILAVLDGAALLLDAYVVIPVIESI
jgi:hypothetical protein